MDPWSKHELETLVDKIWKRGGWSLVNKNDSKQVLKKHIDKLY